MKMDDIKIEVSCETLFENLQLFKQDTDIGLDELNIEHMLRLANGLEKTLHSINIHSGSLPSIVEDFSISDETTPELEGLLKSASCTYLLLFSNNHSHRIFEKYMKRVDEISKVAKKLRDILNDGGNDFAHFLELINHYEEKPEDEPTAHKFLYDTVNMLNVLINIRTKLPHTNAGKSVLRKTRGRPKNQALNIWVYTLYQFWVNVLGRSMKRDPQGLGGRKKFLKFLDRCIEPLHPEMMSYNSDALDTALKELQKKLKRGEKPY